MCAKSTKEKYEKSVQSLKQLNGLNFEAMEVYGQELNVIALLLKPKLVLFTTK